MNRNKEMIDEKSIKHKQQLPKNSARVSVWLMPMSAIDDNQASKPSFVFQGGILEIERTESTGNMDKFCQAICCFLK